ncbi:MAG: low molecular weight protein-tyrosine-phosphatase [Spirochaetaceae bacterium]|nr:low molecular weight phosphotyrosine protein phosphatase [Spirochaetaceae bacterium]MDT8297889.1 low molecular weight protein-tyrosine-phosphatase [Spirochaetaceae bacterium]
MKPFRVMFICSGNICRSPLAQAVFEHLSAEAGLSGEFEIESSGTGAWHVGEQADSRMRKTASAHGVKLNHRSRQLHREDLSDYHLLLTMDHHNHRDTMALARTPEEREKVRLFRDFDPAGTGDVPDPWYGGLDGFEDVWQIVKRTCESLLKNLSSE